MFARKALSSLLSVTLALSMVPTTAIAEDVTAAQELVQQEQAQATPQVEFRINATEDDDPWVSYESQEAAEDAAKAALEKSEDEAETAQNGTEAAEEAVAAPVANEQQAAEQTVPTQDPVVGAEAVAPITKLEVRLKDAQEGDGIELSTFATDQDEEDASWSEWSGTNEGAFSDLKVRLNGEVAKAYEVRYRVHAGGEWLEWADADDESAAPDNALAIDDVAIVLVATDESAVDEDSKKKDAADDATKDVADDAAKDATDKQTTATNATKDAANKQSTTTNATTKNQSKDATKDQAAADKKATEQKEANKKEAPLTPEAEQVSIEAEATAVPTVTYKVHAQTHGWMGSVTNGASAGTTGESKRLEGIQIALPAGTNGDIVYKVHAQTYGWMPAVANGETAGTTGESKRLEAIQIWLNGEVSKKFDVWYRVHAQTYGWLGWVRNGDSAGTTGESKRLEAIQIVLMPKGSNGPSGSGEIGGAQGATASITYHGNVQGFGWMGWLRDGDTVGTTGISAKLEQFSASLVGLNNSDLHYSAHVQTYGWQDEVSGGATVGVEGKRLEAITMRLSGIAEQNYDVYYRCHIQTYGWLNWAKNGEIAGSSGMSRRVEALQVVLVPKGGAAPYNDGRSESHMYVPTIRYRGHVQTYGWLDWTTNGGSAGTTGESKRVEALQAEIVDASVSGEVQINAHVQTYGWRGYVGQGEIAGTTGESKRVEALEVRLTGQLAEDYDVWYRVHAQTFGWMGWAKNGEPAGTEGMSKRLEAIEVTLVAKNGAAPGSTDRAYIKEEPAKLGYQNPPGYYQVSRKNVTITDAAEWPFNYITPSRIDVWATREDCVDAFVGRAYEYLGTPYMWDYACAPGVGVDCIGLVYQCAYATGMDMGGGTGYDDFNPWAHYVTGSSGWHSHDANNFWDYGKALHVPLSSRRAGDVISYSGHAAVYIGDDEVIEAIMGAGVVQRSMWDSGSPRGVIRLFQ